jgi:hypothetical protein
MSDLFESFKNNIFPIQKAIREHTSSFIETLLESDYYNYEKKHALRSSKYHIKSIKSYICKKQPGLNIGINKNSFLISKRLICSI